MTYNVVPSAVHMGHLVHVIVYTGDIVTGDIMPGALCPGFVFE